MSVVNGYGAYQKYAYGDKKADKAPRTDKLKKEERTRKSDKADQTEGTEKGAFVSSQVKLSEKAQKLLEELQKTHDNMDFFVADYETDEEAQAYLSRGTKEYSVLIDPATLEAMAKDDAVKEKYFRLLDDATGELDHVKEELTGEQSANIKSLGISVDKNGNVSYFAELEKMSERQRERIKQQKEDAQIEREGAKQAEREVERKRLSAPAQERELPHFPRIIQRVSLSANTADELLEKIRSVDWNQIKAVERQQAGGQFDFSV